MVFEPPSAEPLQVLVVEHRAPVAHLASMDRPRLLSAIAVALERFRELEVIGTEGSYPREAPETRRLVDRAKRMLITRLGLSEAEAFQRVLDRTHGTGRPLRET